jgi:Flp pilus assembly pilin Flp
MVKRKAQSILEYIIVLSAIVAAVIAMAKGPVTNAVNKMFTDSGQVIEKSTSTFSSQAATGTTKTQ